MMGNDGSLFPMPDREALQQDIRRLDSKAMLVLVDINDFSMLNDLYGEAVGNDILQKSAKELQGLIQGDEAKLYRLYSDKFAILAADEQLFEKYLGLIRYSLTQERENDFDLDVSDEENACIDISYTIGIAYGREELFAKAGLALKNAKKRKRSLVVYDKELNIEKAQQENMARLKGFKAALQQDRIIPYFQPIVDAKTGKTVKYEAIARLINEKGMVVSPMMFLDVAKESRLFEYFTRQVVQKVFQVAAKNPVMFSLNLTYEDIASEEFMAYILNRLRMQQGTKVTFELLESEEVVNYSIIEKFIESVKAYGCRIAIDDFGSGYSNFAHLVKLDADYIKIDGSIIEKIVEDRNSQLMTKILVDFAAEKGIKTIAEYVSSEAIARKAIEMGVDYLQGFYYGEPRPAEGYGLAV